MDEIDLNDIKRRMDNAVEVLKTEFSGLRTGRASANMFEGINVNAYGQVMKLRDLATVSVPESKLVSIQVWDASNVNLIEKGIHESFTNQKMLRVPIILGTNRYESKLFNMSKHARVISHNIVLFLKKIDCGVYTDKGRAV